MTRLTEEQRGLASQYMPLAESLARQSKRSTVADEEDMTSACFATLCISARDYRAGPATFYTFARRRIRGTVIDRIRDAAPHTRSGKNRRASELAVTQISGSSDRDMTVLDYMESKEPLPLQRMESSESFEYMLSFLNHRSQVILRTKYQHGAPFAVAAKKLRVSVSTCELIHNQAIKHLRERFAGTEFAISA